MSLQVYKCSGWRVEVRVYRQPLMHSDQQCAAGPSSRLALASPHHPLGSHTYTLGVADIGGDVRARDAVCAATNRCVDNGRKREH